MKVGLFLSGAVLGFAIEFLCGSLRSTFVVVSNDPNLGRFLGTSEVAWPPRLNMDFEFIDNPERIRIAEKDRVVKLPLKKAECERAYCYISAEVEAMYEVCKSTVGLRWLQNMLVSLTCTGMRIEELCNLKWSDIKFDKRTLTIADESGFARQTDESRSNKSSRARHLPIRAELLEVLESLPHIDQYIFHGPRGGRLKADTVRNVLVREVITPLTKRFPKQFENERSFEDGRLHSFRHYFCSACANTGVPERITMNWLVHADSEMVRHYYHLNDEESRRKMDQLNLLIKSDGRSAADDEQPLKEE